MVQNAFVGRKPLHRKPINITLPEVMKAELEAVADRDGVTSSSIIEGLLRPYLKRSGGAEALAVKQAHSRKGTK